MELRQLRQLIVLAETGNMRRAAERLNMTQPPLSIGLRKLEEELDAKLFERTPREMKLTAVGRSLCEHARRIIAEEEAAYHAVEAIKSGERGTVSLGFVGSATASLLPRLIGLYRRRHPGISLALHESTTLRILDRIAAGDLQLGIVRTPLPQWSPLHIERLTTDAFLLALPRGHPAAGTSDAVELASLAEEPFVGYAAAEVPTLHAALVVTCQQAGFMPRIDQSAVQIQTILSLVASGLGLALVPSSAVRRHEADVVFRPIAGAGPKPTSYLALAHAPALLSPAAGLLIRTARDGLGD